jgi:tRNA dimethylallyltransferase
MQSKTLIVVVGPTAVGKTAAAIQIAQQFGCEILSADSRQLYKELNIGVARPSLDELNAVKHHFIAHLSIFDPYNVYKFEQDALLLLDKLFEKNGIAVMVGGSGLYVDAVCKGIDDLPDPSPELRNRIIEQYETEGIESLQKRLKELDPEYYNIVNLTNPKRLQRAIEVCETTGQTYSSLRKNTAHKRPFRIIKIGLNQNREILYNRINLRVDIMLEMGLLKEAESLYEYRGLNALNTVGYREIFNAMNGDISIEQAITDIKTNSRRYAKRQLTWFKKDEGIKWFAPTEFDLICQYLQSEI